MFSHCGWTQIRDDAAFFPSNDASARSAAAKHFFFSACLDFAPHNFVDIAVPLNACSNNINTETVIITHNSPSLIDVNRTHPAFCTLYPGAKPHLNPAEYFQCENMSDMDNPQLCCVCSGVN